MSASASNHSSPGGKQRQEMARLQRQRKDTGSPIGSGMTEGDKQRRWILVDCLDPLLDWIPDYQRRGQASRMTEKEKVKAKTMDPRSGRG